MRIIVMPSYDTSPKLIGFGFRDSSSGQGDIYYLDVSPVAPVFGAVHTIARNVLTIDGTYFDWSDLTYDPVAQKIIHVRNSADVAYYYEFLSSDYSLVAGTGLGLSWNFGNPIKPHIGAALNTPTSDRIYLFGNGNNNLWYLDYVSGAGQGVTGPVLNGVNIHNIGPIGGGGAGAQTDFAWDEDTGTLWYTRLGTVENIDTSGNSISSFSSGQVHGITIKNGMIYTVDANSPKHLREWTKAGVNTRTTAAGGLDSLVSPGNPQGSMLFDWPHTLMMSGA